MPFLSFSSPFVSKIELLKPSKVKNKKYFLWGKQYVEFFLILGRSRSPVFPEIKRLRNAGYLFFWAGQSLAWLGSVESEFRMARSRHVVIGSF